MVHQNLTGDNPSLHFSLNLANLNAYLESTSEHFSRTRLGQSDLHAVTGGDRHDS
jgi:hypothetical protein